MFYLKSLFVLSFFFSASSMQILESDMFSSVRTLDGVSVSYRAASEEEMLSSGKSVAYAIYNDEEALIVYDQDLFERLDDYSKFLILEHERAHHYLGHSLASKTFKELNQPLENMSLMYRKEKDADCAAGFQSKKLYPNNDRQDVLESFKKIYRALIGVDEVNGYPEWVYNRADKTSTCLEGVLLPYPEVIEI